VSSRAQAEPHAAVECGTYNAVAAGTGDTSGTWTFEVVAADPPAAAGQLDAGDLAVTQLALGRVDVLAQCCGDLVRVEQPGQIVQGCAGRSGH
jgi:hypothetical protein